METPNKIKFSFYGFCIEVKSDDIETIENVKKDFSFFLSDEGTPEISFEVFIEAADYEKLPSALASFYTPRNICYKKDNLSFIDYHGRALTIIDYNTMNYKIYCPDFYLRQEILFMSVLALAAEKLDSKGIHRVHGLGIEINHKACLILLPRGGGKSTLLLDLLEKENVKLISDDSPLINSKGEALPFPLKIGVLHHNKPGNIPEDSLRLFKRMDSDPKYIIDINLFEDKLIKNPVIPEFILCGIRALGPISEITPLSKYATLKEFIKNCVAGLGLYQALEFMLQEGISGLFKKSGVVFSRFKNSYKVISMARTYQFAIGSDKAKNLQTLLDLFS